MTKKTVKKKRKAHALDWIRREGRFHRSIYTTQLRANMGRQKGECTWCGGPVKAPRRTWCSDACVREFDQRCDPNQLRRHVLKRDKGVCAACGLDTDALGRVLGRIRNARSGDRSLRVPCFSYKGRYRKNKRGRKNRRRRARYRGLAPRWRRNGPLYCWVRARGFDSIDNLWQADHIVPVIEGGGLCGLDGYQTLCVPCHKRDTAALARRRKR